MDSVRPKSPVKLLPLQETAHILSVSVEVLLNWNEHHILKPTITPTGEVGYTVEQINQFLQIQKSLQSRNNSQKLPFPQIQSENSQQPQIHESAQQLNPIGIQNEAVADYSRVKKSMPIQALDKNKASFRFFSVLGIILAVLLLAALFQQGQITYLIAQYEKSYQDNSVSQSQVLGAQVSNLPLTLPITPSQNAQKNDVALNKNVHDGDQSVFSGNTPNTLLAKNIQSNSFGNQPTQSPASSSAGITKQRIAEKIQSTEVKSNITPPANTDVHDVSIFASTATQAVDSKNTTSQFDKNGNITGKTAQGGVLAAAVGDAGLSGTAYALNQANNDTRNQLMYIIIFTLSIIVFLMKKPRKALVTAPTRSTTVVSEKLLEIDQRMDGTIVLYIQGKDYKISKPELHSDSDRFFERLMEVAGPGAKEIEYDNFTDEKVKLSTPLSRLVTRLGFVGIKRDLFFPRTSKHNVLFRRYITREDLTTMNLTVNQIINDISPML